MAVDLSRKSFTPYAPKKGEEYMSERMRAHFTAILNKWKQELMEEVDRTVHHMQDEAANFPDPADRATIEEEHALELRTRDRERKLLRKIEDYVFWCPRHEGGPLEGLPPEPPYSYVDNDP